MPEFYYSFDDCDWPDAGGPFDTREEAIEAATEIITKDKATGEWGEYEFDHTKPVEFYVGEAEPFEYVPAGSYVVEDIQEQAYVLAGEASEDWLSNVTTAQEQRLEELLGDAVDTWLNEIGEATSAPFGINKIKSYKV